MHILITKPHVEHTMSPVAFYPEEMLEVPDSFGAKLIALGRAVEIAPVTPQPVAQKTKIRAKQKK